VDKTTRAFLLPKIWCHKGLTFKPCLPNNPLAPLFNNQYRLAFDSEPMRNTITKSKSFVIPLDNRAPFSLSQALDVDEATTVIFALDSDQNLKIQISQLKISYIVI
jgi:hypothetical protein